MALLSMSFLEGGGGRFRGGDAHNGQATKADHLKDTRLRLRNAGEVIANRLWVEGHGLLDVATNRREPVSLHLFWISAL